MSDEIAWLIEFPAQSGSGIEGCPGIERTSWWIGNCDGLIGATHDSLQAVRFARKRDAEKLIDSNLNLRQRGAIATEHAWIDPNSRPKNCPYCFGTGEKR